MRGVDKIESMSQAQQPIVTRKWLPDRGRSSEETLSYKLLCGLL